MRALGLLKQYLKYWRSPGYPGDPPNDPPEQNQFRRRVFLVIFCMKSSRKQSKVKASLCNYHRKLKRNCKIIVPCSILPTYLLRRKRIRFCMSKNIMIFRKSLLKCEKNLHYALIFYVCSLMIKKDVSCRNR